MDTVQQELKVFLLEQLQIAHDKWAQGEYFPSAEIVVECSNTIYNHVPYEKQHDISEDGWVVFDLFSHYLETLSRADRGKITPEEIAKELFVAHYAVLGALFTHLTDLEVK